MKQIRSSEYYKVNVIGAILCLIPFVIGALFYQQLPEQVAVHFDTSNNPNGYASKTFGAFGLPAILCGVQVLMCILLTLDPKRGNASRVMQMLSRLLIPIISIFCECIIVFNAINEKVEIGLIVNLFLGFVFLIIGNLLPKCKDNYTIGIRIPTTLSDTQNWNKTHRFAGFVWVACSIVIIAFSFLKIYDYSWIVILVMVCVPVCYSVLYAVRKKA